RAVLPFASGLLLSFAVWRMRRDLRLKPHESLPETAVGVVFLAFCVPAFLTVVCEASARRGDINFWGRTLPFVGRAGFQMELIHRVKLSFDLWVHLPFCALLFGFWVGFSSSKFMRFIASDIKSEAEGTKGSKTVFYV